MCLQAACPDAASLVTSCIVPISHRLVSGRYSLLLALLVVLFVPFLFFGHGKIHRGVDIELGDHGAGEVIVAGGVKHDGGTSTRFGSAAVQDEVVTDTFGPGGDDDFDLVENLVARLAQLFVQVAARRAVELVDRSPEVI